MEFRIWYLGSLNNDDKGYSLERNNLRHLMDTEGPCGSYNFECKEYGISGCVVDGKLIGAGRDK